MKYRTIMKNLVLCVSTLNLLFLANFILAVNAVDVHFEVEPVADLNSHKFFEYHKELDLICNVTTTPHTTSYTVRWYKNGEDISNIHKLQGRVKQTTDYQNKSDLHKLQIDKPAYEDDGNYTCSILYENKIVDNETIEAIVKARVRIPTNVNVVENEKLRIHCQVLGKPIISWSIDNKTYTSATTDERIKLLEDDETHLPNAILLINNVQMSDRGEYKCIATNKQTGNIEDEAKCNVRIKDKLAALWPFLGICAEVVILCAIILIYEKKRNKQELDESDTDQSPDQKHTPDHGKDSDVRHRK